MPGKLDGAVIAPAVVPGSIANGVATIGTDCPRGGDIASESQTTNYKHNPPQTKRMDQYNIIITLWFH